MNVKKFFNKNYSYLDTYIPPYVNYLIKNKEFGKLKKILILDYFYYYPSIRNTINLTFNKISNVIAFIETFIVTIMIGTIMGFSILIIPRTVGEIVDRVQGTSYSDVVINGTSIPWFMYTISALGTLILLSLFILFFLNLMVGRTDLYTYDEKNIIKMIKSKEKRYNKLKTKVYCL